MKTLSLKPTLSNEIKENAAESVELIYQMLEHINAGRFNEDLIKQKLIQVAKNQPGILPMKFSKYF